MSNSYFESVPGAGNLRLKHSVLVHFTEPVLFVCTDDANGTYLCFATKTDEPKMWLITKISRKNLRLCLDAKLSIRKALMAEDKVILATSKESAGHAYEVCVPRELDASLYPKSQTKLDTPDFVGLAMWPDEKK